jgi:hypothetical protein
MTHFPQPKTFTNFELSISIRLDGVFLFDLHQLIAHAACPAECPLYPPKSGHFAVHSPCCFVPIADIATTTIQSAANTLGLPVTSVAMLGELSGSTRLKLQISPVVAKVASMAPPNCSRARENSRVPKPRWIGAVKLAHCFRAIQGPIVQHPF